MCVFVPYCTVFVFMRINAPVLTGINLCLTLDVWLMHNNAIKGCQSSLCKVTVPSYWLLIQTLWQPLYFICLCFGCILMMFARWIGSLGHRLSVPKKQNDRPEHSQPLREEFVSKYRNKHKLKHGHKRSKTARTCKGQTHTCVPHKHSNTLIDACALDTCLLFLSVGNLVSCHSPSCYTPTHTVLHGC